MVCLLLEDVTLLQQQEVITAHVRFKGGSIETITVAVTRGRRHQPQLLALIEQLLEDDTDAGAARVTRLPNTLFAPFLHVLLFYDLERELV